MSRHVGVLRDAPSLAAAAGALGAIARDLPAEVAAVARSWEATNLLTVAAAVVAAAQARTESRGCHRRSDYPEPDRAWLTAPRRHASTKSGALARRRRASSN